MTQNNHQTASEEKAISTPENPMAIKTPLLSRKNLIRWGAVALVLVILVIGLPRLIHSFTHMSTDDAFIEGSIIPISPRVGGHVAGIYVKDNHWIKAGDLLVVLDPKDFQTRLDVARAALSAAEAADRARNVGVELTKITATSGLDEATSNLEAAKSAVQEAEARLVFSKAAFDQTLAETESTRARHSLDAKDLKRVREMAQSKTISDQDLDRAVTTEKISAGALAAAEKKIETQKAMERQSEAALQSARANMKRAEARLVAARSVPQQILQSQSQAEVSHADINRAKAEVEQARLNLSYTKIYAPADGFVTKKGIEVGQFVQTGQSLMALVSRNVWVTANFKETQLKRMRPGQPVDIEVDAFPDLTLHGHVESIQHGTGSRFSLLPPENATGNFVKVVQRVPVRIAFDSTKETARVLLSPGMSVMPDVNIRDKGWPDNGSKDSRDSPDPRAEN